MLKVTIYQIIDLLANTLTLFNFFIAIETGLLLLITNTALPQKYWPSWSYLFKKEYKKEGLNKRIYYLGIVTLVISEILVEFVFDSPSTSSPLQGETFIFYLSISLSILSIITTNFTAWLSSLSYKTDMKIQNMQKQAEN